MIRDATTDDIPRLLAMGRDFWAATPWRVLGEFDDARAEAGFLAFLSNDKVALFVIADETDQPVGAFGLTFGPLWTTEALLAQELFWWVEPQAAGEALALWKRGEAWAAEHGAHMSMMRLEGLRDGALDRLYRMRGYQAMEHVYLKVA